MPFLGRQIKTNQPSRYRAGRVERLRRKSKRNKDHVTSTTHKGDSENGFTLLEVLVALTILSMSLAALLGVFSQALDRTQEDLKVAAATNLAQAILLQAETTPPKMLRAIQGVTDTGFRWHIRLQDYGDEQDQTNWQENAKTIFVVVDWNDHNRERSIVLSTLRLLPKVPKDE